MKRTKEFNTNKGITLIALVITIIVMLILVSVTISMAVNGGLFEKAGEAVSKTKDALKTEQQLSKGQVQITVGDEKYSSINEYLNKDKERISKEEDYTEHYADVDGNGTVDGIIYVDLAFGPEENEKNVYGVNYEAIPKEELKNYYVSKTNYEGIFGTKDVLAPIGQGKDRFYVVALENLTEEECCWYYSAYGNDNTEVVTSSGFGTGKANTIEMIKKWNASAFGKQNGHATYKDVWGAIQKSNKYEIVETVNDSGKWFVPSGNEIKAILYNLPIHSVDDGMGNFIGGSHGFELATWSSSQPDEDVAEYEYGISDRQFYAEYIALDSAWYGGMSIDQYCGVRLSATF